MENTNNEEWRCPECDGRCEWAWHGEGEPTRLTENTRCGFCGRSSEELSGDNEGGHKLCSFPCFFVRVQHASTSHRPNENFIVSIVERETRPLGSETMTTYGPYSKAEAEAEAKKIETSKTF
jgi:hypothetical protein